MKNGADAEPSNVWSERLSWGCCGLAHVDAQSTKVDVQFRKHVADLHMFVLSSLATLPCPGVIPLSYHPCTK